MNLATIDLNLLLVLTTVLEEKSATRAAQRLHVTQSAVSNSLARLRDLLKDPLVVRSRYGLAPTPRAKELAPSIAAAMAQLQSALATAPVEDPVQCARQFTFACADNQQIHDVPRIAEAMATQMPQARLRVVSPDYLEANDGLSRGLVDAAIAPRRAQPGVFCAQLYTETGVVIARRDHPLVRRTVTRELFNSLGHIDTHIALGQPEQGHATCEQFFRRHRLVRHVALVVPSFTAAAMVAARTDYIACVPKRVALALAEHSSLRVLDMPARGLEITLYLCWHTRTHADAMARYFRELIITALRENGAPRRPAAKSE
jgi:DNA-binding transcriptional LysR family regulator